MPFEDMQEIKMIGISMSDLLRHPWFEDYKNKPNGIAALLYSMGLDIKKPYEVDFCEHRSSMTNEVVKCDRYSGFERTDKYWVNLTNRMVYGNV